MAKTIVYMQFLPTIVIVMLACALPVEGGKSERLTLDYTIAEEQQPHMLIGSIGVDAMLDRKYTSEVYLSLRYTFLRQNEPRRELFDINTRTGVLTTKKKVDREAFCAAKDIICTVTFDVAARPEPVRFLEVIVVRIHIQDLNDNRPEFPDRQFNLPISESVRPGVRLVLPQAMDADSVPNSVKYYELLSPTPKFDLSVKNMSGGGKELRLVVKDRLDREQIDSYRLQLVAWDGGSPALSGTLDIQVIVLDANDNSPKFDNTTYDVTVREDAPLGSVIARVHARDKDAGQNAEVMYSLAAESKQHFGTIFGMQNHTGQLYLKGPLDFESTTDYQLLVTATDRGGWDSIPVHARVNVHVTDVNDHRPRIRVNSLSTTGQVAIPENAEPETFVTHLSVEDRDSGINGEASCALQDYSVHLFTITQIYTNEYTISTIGSSFDRERQQTHTITVVCHDRGKPSLESSKQIIIELLDENDHTPVFSEEIYTRRVRENSTLHTELLTVNATDGDVGENGRLTYKLHSDAQGVVKINSDTGQISTNSPLDYEKMHQVTFRIIAHDNGSPMLSATATVVLNLVDINDEAPIFSEPSYSFATYENQRPGIELGTVTAIDPDSPPYNVVNYALQSSSGVKNTFMIDPELGTISTQRVLDREYQPVYRFLVLAGNPKFPHTTSSVSVTIYVADINDNAPNIEFPNPLNNTVQVPFLAPKGYVLTKIHAYDSDYGVNAHLVYSIAKGNDDGLFDVDSRSGAITVAVPLLQPQKLTYHLSVMVKDGGKPPQTAVEQLYIVVNKTATMFAHRKSQGGSASGGLNNLTIVISLCAATLVLIVVLLIAIILIKRNQRRRGKNGDVYRYTRRVDLASRASAASPKHPPLTSGSRPRYEEDSPPDGMSSSPPPPPPSHLGARAQEQDNNRHPRPSTGGETQPLQPRQPVDGAPAATSSTNTQGSQEMKATRACPLVPYPREHLERPVGERTQGEGSSDRHRYRDPREPGLQPGLQPVLQPGLHPGLQPGIQPGLQPGLHPGLQPGRGGDHRHPARHRVLYDPVHGTARSAARLTERELEVHQLLHMLMRDGTGQDSDSVSGCSADMSNTDSGRGPSEDGDTTHTRADPPGDPGGGGGPGGTQVLHPPPYDSLWDEKRRSSGSLDLKPVPEEEDRPRPNVVKMIAPYTNGSHDISLSSRRYGTTPGPGPRPGVTGSRRFPTSRASPNRPPHDAFRGAVNNKLPDVQQNDTSRGVKPDKNILNSNKNDAIRAKPDFGTNRAKLAPDVLRSSTPKKRMNSADDTEEVIYVNTFGHKMPLHPLGRVDETVDEISDDSASTTTSGSFEVDHGDGCSGSSVQTIINTATRDTVV